MRRDGIERLIPLAGVMFAAVMLAALVLTRGEPDAGASRQVIFDYWQGHHGVQLVAALILAPYGAALVVLFAAALRSTIRAHETEATLYSPIVLAGGIIAAVGLTVTGALDAAVAASADRDAREAVYTLAQLQSYDWVPWVVGFGVMLLAAGTGGLRALALPKALSWSAVVLGVLFLSPAGLFAAFVLPVWTAATGIVLYRRNSGVRIRHSADVAPQSQ
jgi:hypothetical protein